MMSAPGRRATSPSKTPLLCLLAVALALTLAPVAEARVQVRPVEQTVVLDLFSPSDFNDLGVQRDFCRAFTASIDLDERVGRVKTQKFPTFQPSLCTFSHLPRRHSKPREPIRLVGFLFGGAFLGRPARYTKIIMRFIPNSNTDPSENFLSFKSTARFSTRTGRASNATASPFSSSCTSLNGSPAAGGTPTTDTSTSFDTTFATR